MGRHLARRLLIGVPTLLLIVTLSFFMMRLAPGGPFDQERPIPPDILRNIERVYHLDEPLWQQYARYLGGLLQGDFGPSYRTKDFTVSELLARGAPASFTVGGLAVVLAVALGLTAGIVAALRQNSWVDYGVMSLAMVGIAIPSFVMAPLLTLVFGVYLGWLPAGGWGGGAPQFLILPVVSLALPQVARVARLSRGAMIEQLHANYVRTARAKGLREQTVVILHAMRNAMIPVVTIIALQIPEIFGGAVVTEQIFRIPGIGRALIDGIGSKDTPVVMAITFGFAVLVVIFNVVADVLYAALDPRIRYS